MLTDGQKFVAEELAEMRGVVVCAESMRRSTGIYFEGKEKMETEKNKINSIVLSVVALLFFARAPITNATVETGWPAGKANIGST